MKLGKYINQLLPQNETVIIPGFGAFTTFEKPAQIDEEGENMLPPSKEIEFNPQIRNNDGLLVGHIADQENISHFDALHRIEKDREEILYRLDKGEKVELEDIGTFWYNESHQIQFEPVSRADLSPESFGLTATSLSAPELTPDEKSGSKEAEQKETVPNEEQNQPEPEQEFEPVEEIDPELKSEAQEKRKKRSWIWLLFILIPLAGAGIYLWMNQQSPPPEITEPLQIEETREPEIVVQEETPLVDSLQNDSIENEVQDSVTSIEITETTPGELKYYLITGSFKEEENVEKSMEDMKQEGYNPFYLGKKGNFYLVGIKTYNSRREALTAQDSFLAEHPESGAWIYIE